MGFFKFPSSPIMHNLALHSYFFLRQSRVTGATTKHLSSFTLTEIFTSYFTVFITGTCDKICTCNGRLLSYFSCGRRLFQILLPAPYFLGGCFYYTSTHIFGWEDENRTRITRLSVVGTNRYTTSQDL